MPLVLTDDKSTLVQVMAWCRQATSHYLSQCWHRFMLPYGVIRSQWVKALFKTMLVCFQCKTTFAEIVTKIESINWLKFVGLQCCEVIVVLIIWHSPCLFPVAGPSGETSFPLPPMSSASVTTAQAVRTTTSPTTPGDIPARNSPADSGIPRHLLPPGQVPPGGLGPPPQRLPSPMHPGMPPRLPGQPIPGMSLPSSAMSMVPGQTGPAPSMPGHPGPPGGMVRPGMMGAVRMGHALQEMGMRQPPPPQPRMPGPMGMPRGPMTPGLRMPGMMGRPGEEETSMPGGMSFPGSSAGPQFPPQEHAWVIRLM